MYNPLKQSTIEKTIQALPVVPPTTPAQRAAILRVEVERLSKSVELYTNKVAETSPHSARYNGYASSLKQYKDMWRKAAEKYQAALMEVEVEKAQRMIDGTCNTQDEISAEQALGEA